jgi:hypothetical protein
MSENKSFSRRTFVTTALTGIGAIAYGNLLQIFSAERILGSEKVVPKKKRLYATTDFTDNIEIYDRGTRYGKTFSRSDEYYERNQCFLDKTQLNTLHQFLASLGVTRHQWIVDTRWNLYENYPHGFDLLKEAVNSAHKNGLEFYAEIKPWEGGATGILLPHTMPCPEGCGAYKDLRGIFPNMRRFEASNPMLSLKRKPGTYECYEPVSAINLVKSDSRATRMQAGHLSVYTSATNNHFVVYNGPVTFRETVERRFHFPYWKQCRVLHLENLKIPEGHRYILIRCSLADGKGDFSNEKGKILELVGPKGNILPHTLSSGMVQFNEHIGFYQSKRLGKVIPYLQTPEVQIEINDLRKMEEHYRDYYAFDACNLTDPMTLDKEGEVAAVCGKPEYVVGQLNPIYHEVRDYWLDLIRFCLDRKVDGINIRASSHTLSSESWEYGFNEPVLKAAKGKTDYVTLSKINGSSYTQFLREAQELIKSRGKSFTIHLETELIIPDDRGKLSSLPYQFEWQWEIWAKEIADELEIRGTYGFRPWNLSKALDVFGTAVKAAGKPLLLQGDFHGMGFDGPFDSVEEEIKIVNDRDDLDGYVFYETANITRINDAGKLEGNDRLVPMLSQPDKDKKP